MLSQKNRERAQRGWEARRWLTDKIPGLAELLENAGEEKRALLQWTAAAVPATDLGDYPPPLLGRFVEEVLAAREEFPWAGELPEELFLLYVLSPRVNNEGLSDCRGAFRRELGPLVRGLSLPEAIQAVNAWCAGRVAYRSTDGRTSSALETCRRGWGRCGEESVFAVNALRSVGIPARQVYAPWWSHCDDNHAWVEAWDGRSWRYLGACEPEPLLDRGWFTQAAGRAMLIHTRAFLGDLESEGLFPGVKAERFHIREGVAYESVTARYAPVRDFTVELRKPGGAPAAGARVELCILNEGVLRPIASRTADGNGLACLELGLGSLWVSAVLDGLEGELLADTAGADRAVLQLAEPAMAPSQAVDFAAPQDGGAGLPALSPAQRKRRAEVLAQAKARREAGRCPGPCPPAGDPALLRAYAALTSKDQAGEVPLEVLEDCRGAYRFEGGLPEEVFEKGLLSPRIGHEPLAPWRELLAREAPDLPPEELWEWLCERIAPLDSFQEIPQTPAGAWRLRAANGPGRRGLFCAVCRSKGVPARLGALPEYWKDGWRPADGTGQGAVKLLLQEESGGWFGLMRREGAWREADPAGGCLPEGRYLWTASTRLPNGNQLVDMGGFRLEAGGRAEVRPRFRKASPQEFLQHLELPPIPLKRDGKEASLKELLAERGLTLLCWTDPGAEPTQHLLLELGEWSPRLKELGCGTVFLLEPGQPSEGLPQEAEVWECPEEAQEAAARRMYLEPGVLPLALLADQLGRGLFALTGYRVGAGEMLAGIVGAVGALG